MLKTRGDKITIPGNPYVERNLAINLFLFENTRSPVIPLRQAINRRYFNLTEIGECLRIKVFT